MEKLRIGHPLEVLAEDETLRNAFERLEGDLRGGLCPPIMEAWGGLHRNLANVILNIPSRRALLLHRADIHAHRDFFLITCAPESEEIRVTHNAADGGPALKSFITHDVKDFRARLYPYILELDCRDRPLDLEWDFPVIDGVQYGPLDPVTEKMKIAAARRRPRRRATWRGLLICVLIGLFASIVIHMSRYGGWTTVDLHEALQEGALENGGDPPSGSLGPR